MRVLGNIPWIILGGLAIAIGLTSKPPRPNNKTHIMLLQQPVLAEQYHDKGPRRRRCRRCSAPMERM